MRGSGNTDENLNVSAAGRIVFVMHTQEMNANFTGTYLDRRDWYQIGPIHADLAFSGNSQGGGEIPRQSPRNGLSHELEYAQRASLPRRRRQTRSQP